MWKWIDSSDFVLCLGKLQYHPIHLIWDWLHIIHSTQCSLSCRFLAFLDVHLVDKYTVYYGVCWMYRWWPFHIFVPLIKYLDYALRLFHDLGEALYVGLRGRMTIFIVAPAPANRKCCKIKRSLLSISMSVFISRAEFRWNIRSRSRKNTTSCLKLHISLIPHELHASNRYSVQRCNQMGLLPHWLFEFSGCSWWL